MIYKRIAVIFLIVGLLFVTACSQNETTKEKKPPADSKKIVTIDDMQKKINVDDIILTKFTKTMTDTEGKFEVVLAMKDEVYKQFKTITEPYYYTLLLPISIEKMVTTGVKSVPSNEIKELTKDEAAKKGVKVNSQEFGGDLFTFFSIEQSVQWDLHSKVKPSLDGQYDFAIQNEDLVNAFYFSDVQLFVNGFNEKGSY
ncbi:hypothetical protein HBP99_07740 [Listeria booriae]|uniref:DUF5105 domain-containing protein n=1 Tax=Listeria booriae TaxID=1552123 RepID=A0A7X1D005_9LIST|nr:hypothetical protein [Listeria booriae]MBC1233550.1 hypothetical protein [Listeria booriae]MBC1245870.1 hypothetical protein [Listeria booriae]MBC2117982.1 hypothetical protein [Listeria booriae]MBC2205959.1 hypothetical protein [Listeria booriae]MBC2368522.1 hypothetical protein [Listeria booriae]